MKRLLKAVFIFFIAYSGNSFPVSVSGLFEAEVTTQSQSLQHRNKAINDALAIVLGKFLAGDNILENPSVKIALDDASRFTTQYQYSLIPSETDNSSTRIMRVNFDQQALIELMRSSGLGIWNEERDEILVWLVVNQAGKKQIYNEDLMPEIANAITKAAKQKGLPLLFPLMDLEERQQISVSDILGAYSDRLQKVSKRYGTASMLIGRVDKNKKCWSSEWAFYFDNTVKQWTASCHSIDQSMLSGMQGAYDKLSRYYAVKPETLELGTVIVKVSGIKSMTDMSKVTEYLNSLPMTEAVNWLKVESGVNFYKIRTKGRQGTFEDAVGLGRVLDPIVIKGQKNELNYRLLTEINR